MKAVIFIGLFLLSSRMSLSQQIQKKDWLGFYKENAVYRCMCEITDNSLEKDLWKKKDVSFILHEEYLSVFYEQSDSLGRDFALKIKPLQVDSLNYLFGRKPLFQNCLNFYKSKLLDSLARTSYRKYKKLKKRTSIDSD